MTQETHETGSGRGGLFDRVKTFVADTIGATRTRVDNFSAEVEHRMFRMLAMVIWTAVAFACLSLGLTFAMLTVIFGFNLPPKYAFGVPAIVFLAVGLFAVLMFQRKKRSRPAAPGRHSGRAL